MHVLVVHSDPRYYRQVKAVFAHQGASGAYQPSLRGLRYQVEAHSPDLIILEQQCLAEDAGQLGNAFSSGQHLPVIFLTAATYDHGDGGEDRGKLVDILDHLRGRSERAKVPQVTQVGRLRIHAGRMRVALSDRWIRLPPIQFRILQQLAVNSNELVSHQALMSAVWGYEATPEEARELLKVHITQLRRKLGPEFKGYVQAVRGQGYVLVDPESED